MSQGRVTENLMTAATFEEVDTILEKAGYTTIVEKLSYIDHTLGIKVVFDGDGSIDDYKAVVNTLINHY